MGLNGALRFWTVTDDATAMRVMVVFPALVEGDDARRHMRAAGYNLDSPPTIAIVTRLSNSETHHDPFGWADITTRAFHLLAHEDPEFVLSFPDGAEVNVRAQRVALADLIYGR